MCPIWWGVARTRGELRELLARLDEYWAMIGASEAGFSMPEAVRTRVVQRSEREYYRAMSYLERITFDPEQCGGRPCIRGMRIRVKDVLEMLAGGASEVQILQDFPDLQAEDIRACLQYAAAQADHAVLHVA